MKITNNHIETVGALWANGDDITLYNYNRLVVLTISKKYWSMGRIIPYIMENKKCSKQPTR